jgi:hypothetical protein
MTDPQTPPVWLRYDSGMTRKRTFSLPDDLSDALDRVAGGNASAYITAAVRDKIARDQAAQRIRDAYGEPDPEAYTYWVERLASTGAGASPDPGPSAGRPRRAS